MATGTGSGKTECFLLPILDYCAQAGNQGIKAIIIYPMNTNLRYELTGHPHFDDPRFSKFGCPTYLEIRDDEGKLLAAGERGLINMHRDQIIIIAMSTAVVTRQVPANHVYKRIGLPR